MRIASGVIEKKEEGGKGRLVETIRQLRSDFSGYIFVSGENRGYLFVVSGNIVGAVFEGKEDVFRKQGVERILWESEQKNSLIEIHNYPQVNVILEYLPEVRVSPQDLTVMSGTIEEPGSDIKDIKRMYAPTELERIPRARAPLRKYLEEEIKEKHEKITEKLKEGYTIIPLKTKVEFGSDEETRILQEKLKTLLAEDMRERPRDIEIVPVMKRELRELLGDQFVLKAKEDEADKRKKEKVLSKVLKGAPVTLKRREFERPEFEKEEEVLVDPIAMLKEEDEKMGEGEKLLARLNIPKSIIKKKRVKG